MKNLIRVVLYIRVSSEEQVLHGDSLEAQEKALMEYAEKKGYKIVKVYKDEGYSARKPAMTRKAMQNLLNDARDKLFDLIIFTKIDRWFRNVGEYHRVQSVLEANNVHWKTILEDYDTQTADGRLKINIMLSVAENEADRTSERIRFVNAMKVQKKEPITGSQPWGYMTARVDDKKCIIKNPELEPIVNEMFEHFLTYKSASATNKYLNDKYGVDRDRVNTIQALKNEKYTGKYRDIPDYYPAYITPDQYKEIQRIFKEKLDARKPYLEGVDRTYLLKGLMKCPVCGHKLTVRVKVPWGRNKQYYISYRCWKHAEGGCTFKKSISQIKVEKWILDNIESKLNEYILKIELEEMSGTSTPKRDARKYEDRLKRLNTAYIMGNLTDSEYISTSKELKSIIADIEMENKPVKSKSVEELEEVISGDFRGLYELLDQENKRALLTSVIKEIVIDGNDPVDIIFL